MIVLASASPRRKEILTLMGYDFRVLPAEEEKNPSERLDPAVYVMISALSKAKNVASRVAPDDIVIGADTVVFLDGAILGKPKDKEDAFRMLKSLSGKTHLVYTGFSIMKGETEITDFEKTEVSFREMSDEEIRSYIETGEPMDKAGAYGIQGYGCVNVRAIHGDYFNVMGFPACHINEALKRLL